MFRFILQRETKLIEKSKEQLNEREATARAHVLASVVNFHFIWHNLASSLNVILKTEKEFKLFVVFEQIK